MKYGVLPRSLGIFHLNIEEMMLYQYLPIKMSNDTKIIVEERLMVFNDLLGKICCDYIGTYGLDNYTQSYIYLTAKRQYQQPMCSINRTGWHSDGYLTSDINYIWSDKDPTIFNTSEYSLSPDDQLSLKDMDAKSLEWNNVQFEPYEILCLDQYCIHKVAPPTEGFRTFIKVSFSNDKYDLQGNSHNYLLDYNWNMRPRKFERNIPQKLGV